MKQTNKQTNKQTKNEIMRQTDRQTDGQGEVERHRQTETGGRGRDRDGHLKQRKYARFVAGGVRFQEWK